MYSELRAQKAPPFSYYPRTSLCYACWATSPYRVKSEDAADLKGGGVKTRLKWRANSKNS